MRTQLTVLGTREQVECGRRHFSRAEVGSSDALWLAASWRYGRTSVAHNRAASRANQNDRRSRVLSVESCVFTLASMAASGRADRAVPRVEDSRERAFATADAAACDAARIRCARATGRRSLEQPVERFAHVVGLSGHEAAHVATDAYAGGAGRITLDPSAAAAGCNPTRSTPACFSCLARIAWSGLTSTGALADASHDRALDPSMAVCTQVRAV